MSSLPQKLLIATLLALACAAHTGAVDYAAAVREDRPLAWWRFEDDAYHDGAAAKDEVAGRPGTYHRVQREAGVPGIGGHAARFDGTASFLEVPHHPAFALDELSVEFWFKATQPWNATQWPGSATFISRAMPTAGFSASWG